MTTIPSHPDLIACVLLLEALHDAGLERTQGHRAHGLFLDLLRSSEPGLAAALHDGAGEKPFTVTPIQGRFRQLRPGAGYTLRVSLLRGDLFPPFARAFYQPGGRTLHLGRASFALREALTTPGSHPWANLTSWAQLLDSGQPKEQLSLQFCTPTAFKLSDLPHSKTRFYLLPDPARVFGSLLRRWNALSPHQLPVDLLERVDILIREVKHIETEALRSSRSKQLGFKGHCIYEVRGDAEARRIVHSLALAAFYLGVGVKTTQGMGLARLLEV